MFKWNSREPEREPEIQKTLELNKKWRASINATT